MEESNLVKHAFAEFKILGWDKNEDEQKDICKNILQLLRVFAAQDHSRFNGSYLLSLFNKLAKFNPISPLTGEDSEWVEISTEVYQNRRDSSVFKDGKHGAAYWIEGIIFRDKNGCSYTSKNSRFFIQFPWTKPEPEIK